MFNTHMPIFTDTFLDLPTDWSQKLSIANPFNKLSGGIKITYGNGMFLSSAYRLRTGETLDFIKSTDGINFSTVSMPSIGANVPGMNKIFFSKIFNAFYVYGYNIGSGDYAQITKTVDGTSFSDVLIISPHVSRDSNIIAMGEANGKLIAFVSHTNYPNGLIYSSTDGINFTTDNISSPLTIALTSSVSGIAYVGGNYVWHNYSTFVKSADLINVTAITNGLGWTTGGKIFQYGSNAIYLKGTQSRITDGTTVSATNIVAPFNIPFASSEFYSADFDRYIYTSGSDLTYSPDLVSFTYDYLNSLGTITISGIAFGGGKIVGISKNSGTNIPITVFSNDN